MKCSLCNKIIKVSFVENKDYQVTYHIYQCEHSGKYPYILMDLYIKFHEGISLESYQIPYLYNKEYYIISAYCHENTQLIKINLNKSKLFSYVFEVPFQEIKPTNKSIKLLFHKLIKLSHYK